MPEIVIPSLYLDKASYLTDRKEKIGYVIDFVFSNPGIISTTMDEELGSYLKLKSKFSDDPDKLCHMVQASLERIYERVFDTVNFEVSVTYETDDTGTVNRLKLNITDNSTGSSVLNTADVSLYDDRFTLTVA